MEPVRPGPGGGRLTDVVPGLLGAREWSGPDLAGARAVVLLVLDGLGWNALEQHRPMLPELAAGDGGPITTVVPSTTSTALTSLVTGLAPSQHGVMGYRMRVDGGILNVLRWQYVDGRRPPDPFEVQRHACFLGREVPVLTRSEFRTTGFTEAHLRGSRFVGWGTVSTLVEHVRRLVAAGERFVYAYYPGIDTVAHEYGLVDGYFEAELRAADGLLGAILDSLPGDVRVVVTADHGQVHTGREGWVSLARLDALVDDYAGDGRFRFLYARRGAAAELAAAAREEVGHLAWVMERAELFDDGWLGPPPTSPSIPRRVGDVVLAAREPVAFIDPTMTREQALLAGHGSVTPDEMLVPLLVFQGRA
ncbi:MAG: alkaline phosphatase family protein [Acidimicrobiia bacterium]